MLVSHTLCVSIFTASCDIVFAEQYSGKCVYIFVGGSVMMIGSDVGVVFLGVFLGGGSCIRR